MAGIALTASRLRWPDTVPVRVELRSSFVAPVEEYRPCFGCEVADREESNAVVIKLADAHRTLPPALPGLADNVQRYLERALLQARSEADPQRDLRRALRDSFATGELALPKVARRLGVGARSQQCRLACSSTSCQEVLEQNEDQGGAERVGPERPQSPGVGRVSRRVAKR